MASRPLPPGRRGRGPRVASGLHHLPEPKLLDVPVASRSNSELHMTETHAGTHAKPELPPSPAAVPPPATPEHVYAPPPVAHPPAILEPVAEPSAPVALPTAAMDTAPVKHRVEHVVAALEERSGGHVLPRRVTHHDAPNAALHAPATRYEPAATAPTPVTPAPPAPTARPEPAAPAMAPAAPAAVAPRETVATAATPPPAPATTADSDSLGPFHPFALLLPIDAVPIVPESVECLFDADAVAMQKCVLKVVRKLLGADRTKLEDFKINARLFGNSFMEPYEYLESLVQAFGAVRALQFVPSLLTIQADHMKRSGLLLAARNYRLRNLAALETQVAAMRAATVAPSAVEASKPVAPVTVAPEDVAPKAPVAEAVETPTAVAPAAEVTTETVPAVAAVHAEPEAAAVFEATEPRDDGAKESIAATEFVVAAAKEVVEADSEAAAHGTSAVDEPVSTATAIAALVGAVAPPAEQAGAAELRAVAVQDAEEHHSEPNAPPATTGADSDESKTAPVHVESPTPAVQRVETPAVVAAPVHEPPAVKSVPRSAEPAFSVSDLPLAFQQAFASSPPSSPVHRAPAPPAPPSSSSPPKSASHSASGSSSFAEAENLFGERFSTGSTNSDNAETLFGERIYHTAPVAAAAGATSSSPPLPSAATDAPKPAHAQLLFGFATAGADSDSDSDDSGFSSP